MLNSNRIAVPRGSDGLALIGRSLLDLRGIRFVEGEDGNAPADENETPDETETGTHDESVCAAKIAELTAANAQLMSDNADLIADHAAELTAQKAANYDLLQQIPGDNTTTDVDDELDENGPDIDDLFTPKES